MDEFIRHGGDIYCDGRKGRSLLDFSANINPAGIPESVKAAAKESLCFCETYPDPLCRELRYALGEFHGLDPAHIVCGNGAADVIFRLVFAVKPKKALVVSPTFSEYESALKAWGCDTHYIDLDPDKDFIPDENVIKGVTQGTELVFFCNPNNPTGMAMPGEFVKALLDKCREAGAILVVDECFLSFIENEEAYSAVRYIRGNNRLFILKAFTKMYAMAGIRLGYGLCSDTDLINKITVTGQPWSVSTIASKCGVAALKEKEFVKRTVQLNKQERIWLSDQLASLGLKVYKSFANYMMFKSEDTSLCQKLEEQGVLIRSCSNYRGLGEGFYRVAVKKHSHNLCLVEALKNVMPAHETS